MNTHPTELDILLLKQSVTAHKMRIIQMMCNIVNDLMNRGIHHDNSKVEEPEVELFSSNIQLFNSTINSHYTEGCFTHLGENIDNNITKAKKHHYKTNRHHPEHFENGVNDMNMLDIVEMLCDWLCSNKKYTDINEAMEMLEVQRERFNLDDQLYNIIKNTIPILVDRYE